jgi:hypothetical protein
MTMPTTRPVLSRRALFGLGGSTLFLAAAATAWRWRARAEASPRVRLDAPILYADHDGWMVSLAEKRALRARSGGPTGAAR